MKINGEILARKGEMLLLRAYIRENGDEFYMVIRDFGNWLHIKGLGLGIYETFRDAERRMMEFNDVETIEKIRALMMAYQHGEEQ